MIEETGVITEICAGKIRVATQIKSTCSGCQVNSHCGTGVVARALSPKIQQLELECNESVQLGQQVKLGIPEQTLLGASALVYLLPLINVLIAITLGSLWLNQEGGLIALALLTGFVSFWGVRYYLQRHPEEYQPRLISVVPQPIAVVDLSLPS